MDERSKKIKDKWIPKVSYYFFSWLELSQIFGEKATGNFTLILFMSVYSFYILVKLGDETWWEMELGVATLGIGYSGDEA